MRRRASVLLLFALFASVAAVAAEPSAAEVLNEMRQARLDPAQVYYVRELNVYREELRLFLVDGMVAFLQPVRGKVTGAIFVGQGEVLLIPPDAVERRSVALFTGSPVLNENFSSAMLRFTDNTYNELREAIAKCEKCEKRADSAEFLSNWNPVVGNLHGVNELRVLADLLAARPVPFFAARVSGDKLGVFDIVMDYRHPEQLIAGQSRFKEGQRYTDLWCSFTVRSARGRDPEADNLPATRYRLDSRILPSRVLQVKAEVDLVPSVAGERVFAFELSRYLKVSSVQVVEAGRAPVNVEFFQNALLDEEQVRRSGNDQVTVVLPAPTIEKKGFTLRFVYEGEVISEAGNGVLFVGARGSWFPHRGLTPALFDLTFRYPLKQTLVATGERVDEREESEWRLSRWTSPVPVRLAGFNVGDYEKGQARSGQVAVEVYANKALEPELERRRERTLIATPSLGALKKAEGPIVVTVPAPLPPPAEIAARIATESADTITFYTRSFGPLPLHRVAISPIPGNFGQGWPGLVYASTRSFMAPFEQESPVGQASAVNNIFLRVGLRSHELAHQWWGNMVAPASYRDEWLIEGLSNYSALIYIASRRGGERNFRLLLDQYRDELLQKVGDKPAEEAGPPVLGYRLNSSERPNGVDLVMYKKATWIMHMLRQLMRDPKTGSDDRFFDFLRAVVENYNQNSLSTDHFRELAEKYVIPGANFEGRTSLDWFFEQWAYSTGIPEVQVKSSVEKKGTRFQVKGTVALSNVDDGFALPVPVYAQTSRGQALLGIVSAMGKETSFSFSVATAPQKVVADPRNTLLAVYR